LESQILFEESSITRLLAILIIPVPLIVVGGLLLRKYDRDRKKEKEMID